MLIFRDKYRKRQLARMDIGRLRECASWGARNTVNSPETEFANRLLARREREAARLRKAARHEREQRAIAAHIASGPDSWRAEFPSAEA